MRRMTAAFNGLADEGRQTSVLLALHHALEMLLKAALRERRVEVFDRDTARSIGFEKCLRLARQHLVEECEGGACVHVQEPLIDGR